MIVLAALAALALEALGLYSGTTTAVVIAGLLTIIAAVVISRVSLHTAGTCTAIAAAFTLSWNGLRVGPVILGDLLVLLALILLFAACIGDYVPALPWWAYQLGLVVVFIATVRALVPTSPDYLARRIIIGSTGLPMIQNQTNLGVAFKLLVAGVMIPFVFALAAHRKPRVLRWLTIAFASGVAVSGLIAFSDSLGISNLGLKFTHVAYGRSRQTGLTVHPNFLAGACVLSVSVAIWLLASRKGRSQVLGAALLLPIVLGAYATGSRGGAVGIVFAIGVAVLLIPRFRPHLPTIAFGTGTLALAVIVIVPSLGAALGKATRLSGGSPTTSGSNIARQATFQQGLDDLHHSPIFGIGLQVAAEAQNVYLQELAAGGIMLFAAMLVYTLFAARAGFLLMRVDDLARPLLASLIAGAVFNSVEASLTDRFSYVMLGLLIALAAQHRFMDATDGEILVDIRHDPVGGRPGAPTRAGITE